MLANRFRTRTLRHLLPLALALLTRSVSAAAISSLVALPVGFEPLHIADDGRIIGVSYGMPSNVTSVIEPSGSIRAARDDEALDPTWPGNADGTAGLVSFTTDSPDGKNHVLVDQKDGVFLDFGGPTSLGFMGSYLHAVNLGAIAVGHGYDDLYRFRAVYYDGPRGQTINLSDLIPSGSVFDSLNTAVGLNNFNQVIGRGLIGNEMRGFVATVVPEPAPLVAFALLAVALVGHRILVATRQSFYQARSAPGP
jgi:hypothetical protein